MHATDIVAYTYNADIYCPTCITRHVLADHPVRLDPEDYAVDSAGLAAGSPESILASMADELGIDHMDEYSYDSGEFPKVVFASQIEDDEYCGNCHEQII